jgi:hypothetical protein
MRVSLLAPLALLALSLQPALAAENGTNPTQLAQRLERELSESMSGAQARTAAIDTGTLDRIEGEIRRGATQWTSREDATPADTTKLERLRGLIQNARIYNDNLGRGVSTSLPYATLETAQQVTARQDRSTGSNCQQAWPVVRGKPIASDLAPAGKPGDQFWLRVQASGKATAVSTLGSTGDVDLAVYASCGDEQPLLVNDDYYGLQALVQLPPSEHGELFVRVRNLDASTPTQARMEAILSTGFSGTVSIAPPGTASPLAATVAYFDTQNGYYQGIIFLDNDGHYSINTLNPGTYFARTASSSSPVELVHEAYDNIPCPNSSYYSLTSCNSAPLSVITVTADQITPNINFELELGRALQLITRDANTGEPVISSGTLYTGGIQAAYANADATGRLRFSGLVPGIDYRAVVTADGYQSKLYDNIACPGYCDPAAGTPIVFAPTGAYFRELNLTLMPRRKLQVHIPILPQTSSYAEARLLYPSGQNAASAYAYYQGVVPGYVTVVFTDPPAGDFYLQAGYAAASYWRLYPNINCLDDCPSLLTQAQTINVSANSANQEIYVDVQPFPALVGTITEAATSQPTSGVTVTTIVLGSGSGNSASTDVNGNYNMPYVRPGSYLIVATSPSYIDIAYPNAPCSVVNYSTVCPTATPVTVGSSQPSYRYDFALTPSGRVSGTMTIEGNPANYYYYSPQLTLRRADGTTASGILERDGAAYTYTDVDPGSYRASVPAQVSSYGQIYPGIDCVDSACDSTSLGQPVTISTTPLSGINFDLRLRRGAKGRVVDASTGLPLNGVVVDIWQPGYNYPGNSAVTGPDGRFSVAFNDNFVSTFKIATSVGSGYVNEIYRNVQCPLGPAIFSLCDINLGEAVNANHTMDSRGITIRLMPEALGPLFDDSFDD